MKSHIAYICAGSNIGDKAENCRKGLESIAKARENILIAQSAYYKTEPVDYKDQDWFINVVAKVETVFDPFNLLKELKKIEKDAGRAEDQMRFGPRALDIDIIFYDDIVINEPGLKIPHPRMHKRCFVLKPLCDIDPDIIHPVSGKSVQYLLDNIDDNEQKVVQWQ